MSNVDAPVILSIEDGVATIRLNRPEQGNALSLAMAEHLAAVAETVTTDPAVRCVLLTGSGRFFCVGGDIGAFREAGDAIPALLQKITGHLNAAIGRLAQMERPLIVAVNGPAAGAGFGLAILGDMVLGARSAHFTMAYTAIGLTPDGGTSILLPRLIGLRRAQELALTNRRVLSDEAASIGLISRIVEDDQLDAEAHKLAATLAKGPTRAFATVRRLLASGYETALDAQLAMEAQGISDAAANDDGMEGIAAFLAKRQPTFTGR